MKNRFQEGPHVDFHGSYEVVDDANGHKARIQSVANEIWKATGYRFTCVSLTFGKMLLSYSANSVSRTTPNLPTDIKHVSGALKTRLIDPNPLEQLGKRKENSTGLVRPVQARYWPRTGFPVKADSLSRPATRPQLDSVLSQCGCTIMSPTSLTWISTFHLKLLKVAGEVDGLLEHQQALLSMFMIQIHHQCPQPTMYIRLNNQHLRSTRLHSRTPSMRSTTKSKSYNKTFQLNP